MLKRVLATLVLGFAAVTAQADEAKPAYTTLANPGKVEKAGMIEVREFFWYGCPHCYKLDPHLVAWLKTKPADVNFIRTPAALNPVWEANARGFYAVQAMGLEERTHTPLFQAIHVGKQQLFDQSSLAKFYSGFGVNQATFSSTYNSFAVGGKIAQSKALAKQYQLDGVPAVVVNGKYLVKGEDGRVIAAINELIAKERVAGKKAK